jgi:hypothetical protein
VVASPRSGYRRGSAVVVVGSVSALDHATNAETNTAMKTDHLRDILVPLLAAASDGPG